MFSQIEGYGFAESGGVPECSRRPLRPLGWSLPVNTHGGLLSEGYIHGMNHVYEAVEQIRGEAGHRQVARHRCRARHRSAGLRERLLLGRRVGGRMSDAEEWRTVPVPDRDSAPYWRRSPGAASSSSTVALRPLDVAGTCDLSLSR